MGKQRNFIFYFLLIILFFVPACFHIEVPHWGKTRDAETGEPLTNTSVTLNISYDCPYPPEGISGTLATEDVFSDENGNYSLPFRVYPLRPLCWTDKYFRFIKPGYFPSGDSKLFKMTYFLDFLFFKDPTEYSSWSESYKTVINKMKIGNLVPMGDKGVFLTLKDKKLSIIYTRDLDVMVYDEVAGKWLTLDSRGKFLKLRTSKLPEWLFFSFDESMGWHIYANRDAIFYPVDEKPIFREIKFIEPEHGNISALSGSVTDFFTIEDNESKLCHYGYINVSYINPAEKGPDFLKCWSWSDLPKPRDDDRLEEAKFKFLAPIGMAFTRIEDAVQFVVMTPNKWHFYNYERGTITELSLSFLPDKEITAFVTAVDKDGFFIAFKHDGIRKYIFKEHSVWVEDKIFHGNSSSVFNGVVRSLAIGHTTNNSALYAVTGEDTIYRFSLEGFPDYLVRMKD
jgi:hypothetical protein